MTTPTDTRSADEITITWSIHDIRELRADLTDNQCREVLALAKRNHDANIGINWNVLEIWAEHLYPQDAS